jgi:signal peptidase II
MQTFLIASFSLSLDQVSKAAATRSFNEQPLSLGRFVQLKVTRSVARTRLTHVMLIIWPMAAASILVLMITGPYFDSTIAGVGLGLALGGAAGNLLDRVRSGRITDFIAVGWWPVFNVADIAIVLGLSMAFVPELTVL